MTFLQQAETSLTSPLSIRLGSGRFYRYLALYLLVGSAIFGGFSYFLLTHQDWLKQQVVDYLLPQSWQSISARIIDFFFDSQTKTVLIGMILNGSLVMASIILFPIKERCSFLFEQDLQKNHSSASELPLWLQALEETKLLFLYITAQSIIFAIGYYPYPWCSWLSSILSMLFLCFSFGLDFISPTLQRKRVKYNIIIKWLAQKWLLTMCFGAIFALPGIYIGQWIFSQEKIGLMNTAAILFAINLIMLTLAIPAGTLVATQLTQSSSAPNPFSPSQRQAAYTFLFVTLILSGSLHTLVARSMHRKSQILKCEYSIDWSSLNFQAPQLSQFLRGEKSAQLRFNLEIHNPTTYDFAVEDSLLSVWHNEKLVSSTKVKAFQVSSGATTLQPMHFTTHLDINGLADLSTLTQHWKVQLEFQLLPGVPFLVELYNPNSAR